MSILCNFCILDDIRILIDDKFQLLPLDQTELDMPEVTGRLTQTIGEVGSWMEVTTQQLNDSVVFPVRRLITELDQLHNAHKPMFHDCRATLTDAEERFAKASKKDAPRKLEEVNNDVFLAKQNFHQVTTFIVEKQC